MNIIRWVGLMVVVVGLIWGGLPESAEAQINPLISRVVWSPDGQRVAVGYEDGRLEIRDGQGNEAPLILTGHHYRISDLAWNSTGNQLASGSEQELFVWDAATGQMIHDLLETYGYSLNIQGISWNKDDSRIMVFTFGSPDLLIWNAATFQLVSEADDAELSRFSWSLDRNQVVGSNAGGLDIRDSLTFTPDAGVGEPGVYVAAWSPEADRIVTGTWSGQIRIWDVPSEAMPREPLPELPLNRTLRASTVEPDFDRRTTFVMAVTFDLTGTRVYSVLGSGELAAWDANNGALISTTQLENAPISAAAFNQLGTKLAYGDANGELHMVDVAQSNPLISRIVWSPDGQRVAVGYEDGRLEIRDVQGNEAPLILTGHRYRILTIGWNVTGTQLASGSERELFVWDATNGQLISDLNATYGHPSYALGIDWNRDNSQIVIFVASSPNRQTWNATTFQLVSEVDDAQMGEIIWSLDGGQVAAGTTGGLDIRDSMTFTPNSGVNEPGISAGAWSPRADRIVTGNWSGQIRIWDVLSETTLSETLPELPLNRTLRASTVEPDFDRRTTFVMAVAFDLTGTRVYSVSGSGEFMAWDANNGALISTTQLENAPITAAAFNQLGTKLAYGDTNGELHMVDVATLVPPETFGALPTFFRISDGQAASRLLQ